MDKSANDEWKKRPAWVRAMFLGSTRLRMGRREHARLEAVEVATAGVLAAVGLCGLFDVLVPSAAAPGFLLFSLVFIAAAYLTSFNVRVGDRFSVWPWLESRSVD